MERVAKLAEMIREEIADAQRYAMCALKARDSRPAEARTYGDIANQELGHADKLHAIVVDAIDEARRSGGEVPEGMELVWDYEHGRIVEETAAVRNLLLMLNG